MFPITPPGNGNVGMGPRDLWEFGFKLNKNSLPAKKSPAKFRKKIKITILWHDFFPLLQLKMFFLFKNLLLNWPLFIFCMNSFLKFSLFSQMGSPIWPCVILCACAKRCAPTVNWILAWMAGYGVLPDSQIWRMTWQMLESRRLVWLKIWWIWSLTDWLVWRLYWVVGLETHTPIRFEERLGNSWWTWWLPRWWILNLSYWRL